jgi:hypothetical protein
MKTMTEVWMALLTTARRTGKTTAMIAATAHVKGLLVTSTAAEAETLRRHHGIAAVGVQHPEELWALMKGRTTPVLFDPDAVATIGLFYARQLSEMGLERKKLMAENTQLHRIMEVAAHSQGEETAALRDEIATLRKFILSAAMASVE